MLSLVSGFVALSSLSSAAHAHGFFVREAPAPQEGAHCVVSPSGIDPTQVCSALQSTSPVLERVSASQFKNDQQIEAYFQNTPNHDGDFERYTQPRRLGASSYEQQVDQAAQTFHIPPAFLACMLDQENHFMSSGVSRTGARSIAQFEPSTLRTMNYVIAGRVSDSQTVCSTDAILYNNWQQYWQQIGQAPPRAASMSNPSEMIAAAALYNMQNAMTYFGEAGAMNLSMSQLKILAAAYNWGPGKIKTRCGIPVADADECLKIIEGTSASVPSLERSFYRMPAETQAYVSNIESCVAAP
ncbi:MAG: hypothetical protein P4M08_14405 [Oligoflexia bacterium]|nr:hypothetical protein [Oligoflexia bacterium]